MFTTMKKQPKKTPTKMVRISTDLVDMLSAIIEVEGVTISDILDPLIRPQVTARYQKIKDRYEAILKLKSKAKRSED